MFTRRFRLITWISFFSVNLLYLGTAIFVRPIADDYCAGYGVKLNAAGYIGRLFTTWSGDITQIIANVLFVGLPIAHFPLIYLGIIVQIVSMATILLSIFLVLKMLLDHPGRQNSLTSIVFILAIIEFLWLLYWALPVVFNFNPSYSRILDGAESFSAIQGWPTVIVQYSIVPFSLFATLLLLELQKYKSTVAWFILGIALGFSGYVLAVTSIVTILLCRIFRLVRQIPGRYLFFSLGCLSAMVVSYLSPGARARTTALSPFALNQYTPEDFFRWFFVSFFEFISLFINVGFVIVIGFVYFLASTVFSSLDIKIGETLNLNAIKICCLFLFLYYVLISVSEFFTYPAFWHLITFKICIFIFALLLGLVFARRFPLKNHVQIQDNFIRIFLVSAISASLLFVIIPSNKLIVERGLSWEQGSSSLPGISDISENWVRQCWTKLSELREFSSRL